MAVFLLDKQAVTLTIHKDTCSTVPREVLQDCERQTVLEGAPDDEANLWWICDKHFTTAKANIFVDGRFWSVNFCDVCFGKGTE